MNIHGKNALLYFEDATGASANLSGDGNNITLSELVTNPEVSVIGDGYVQRSGSGLSDVKITYEGWANDTAGLNLDIFSQMRKLQGLVRFAPSGSLGMWYSGSMRMTGAETRSVVNSIVAARASFELSSGSLSTTYFYYLLLETGDHILTEASEFLTGEY